MVALIGYLGSFLLLLSYFLFANGKLSTKVYLVLNCIGCVFGIIFGAFAGGGSVLLVNLGFLIIGLLGLRNGKSKSTKEHQG